MLQSKVQKNNQHENAISNLASDEKSALLQSNESAKKPISAVVFDNKEISSFQNVQNHSVKDSTSDKSTSQETEQSKCPRYSFNTEIPEKYDDSYLCILPRTPKSYYVYWEQPDGSQAGDDRFDQKNNSEEQWILRINELSQDKIQHPCMSRNDVPIKLTDNNSYINIPHTISPYNIECGILAESGHFTSVASTGSITDASVADSRQQSSYETPITHSNQSVNNLSADTEAKNSVKLISNHKTDNSGNINNNLTDKSAISKLSVSTRYFGSASPV